jgi:hypothetical protein
MMGQFREISTGKFKPRGPASGRPSSFAKAMEDKMARQDTNGEGDGVARRREALTGRRRMFLGTLASTKHP